MYTEEKSCIIKVVRHMEENLFTNKLINEKSQYLLQAAHDLVDWYPWGDEAFKLARDEDKPIFLSIGYSTCHWCHVMRRESFNDIEIAKLMNSNFVNVKVDREEFPDVDGIYMELAQAMMPAAAGWPLNLVLTHELTPIFVSTYLTPDGASGQFGMKDVIMNMHKIWYSEEREKAVMQSQRIVTAFTDRMILDGGEIPPEDYAEQASLQFYQLADPIFGGIKGQPKFLAGYQANFMMRVAKKYSEGRALFYAEKTLEMMYRGGVYDHLGGGFSRYSVDDQWKVPHFEKMMYDNAIQAHAYLEAWKATGNALYRTVCRQIIDYILSDMTNDKGGFCSAQGATKDGTEDGYYTWTHDEVVDVLGDERGKVFCDFYGVTGYGNYDGRNILYIPSSAEEFSRHMGLNEESLSATLSEGRSLLLKARSNREALFRDDKVLTSWNALMIFSLVEAGLAFGDDAYLQAAERAAYFVKMHLQEYGHLLRRWRDNDAHYFGTLNDYAYMIKALITMFEADRGIEWLEWAMHLTGIIAREFRTGTGLYYFTDGLDPNIIFQRCPLLDGSEPSGNAVHCENLLRLHRITRDSVYLEQAEGILSAAKSRIDQYLLGHCYHLMSLMRYYDKKSKTIVIALNNEETCKKELRAVINKQFIPHKVVIWKRIDDDRLSKMFPWMKVCEPVGGETALYLNGIDGCAEPLTDLSSMIEAIKML